MSLSKQTCIILKSLWLLIISYHASFCCCHLLFWTLCYQQIHPFTRLVENDSSSSSSSSSSVQCPNFNSLKTLTLTVRSGLVQCFHNPPNSSMDYRSFKVHLLSFCIGLSHLKDFCRVCTELDSGEISLGHVTATGPSSDHTQSCLAQPVLPLCTIPPKCVVIMSV